MNDKIKIALLSIVALATFALVMYTMYWIVKTFSYWLFYEEMVRETVIEMVKRGALL